MTEIVVWCLLIDHEKMATRGNAFSVKASSDADIDDLKKKIKEKRPNALKNVDPATLTVWRCTGAKLLADVVLPGLEEVLSKADFRTKQLDAAQKITALSASYALRYCLCYRLV